MRLSWAAHCENYPKIAASLSIPDHGVLLYWYTEWMEITLGDVCCSVPSTDPSRRGKGWDVRARWKKGKYILLFLRLSKVMQGRENHVNKNKQIGTRLARFAGCLVCLCDDIVCLHPLLATVKGTRAVCMDLLQSYLAGRVKGLAAFALSLGRRLCYRQFLLMGLKNSSPGMASSPR